MIDLKIELMNDDAVVPTKGSAGAAGYDLYAVSNVNLWQGHPFVVKTGLKMEIPDGYVGLIRDRSGLAAKFGVTTRAGVIDSDYRGEVGVVMVNEREGPYQVLKGERIAQILFVKCDDAKVSIGTVGATERGSGGFGSTGQ